MWCSTSNNWDLICFFFLHWTLDKVLTVNHSKSQMRVCNFLNFSPYLTRAYLGMPISFRIIDAYNSIISKVISILFFFFLTFFSFHFKTFEALKIFSYALKCKGGLLILFQWIYTKRNQKIQQLDTEMIQWMLPLPSC